MIAILSLLSILFFSVPFACFPVFFSGFLIFGAVGFPSFEAQFPSSMSAEETDVLINLIRSVVQEELEKVEGRLRIFQSSSNSQSGSGTLKFKLYFLNQIASPIFTNNEIVAENGEPLRVALCDVTNNNDLIDMGPLSSAQIEIVVLDGEFSSGQRNEETRWTVSDFNRNVLSQRVKKGPLIVGNDLNLCMENGVALINNLCFTDNSSWLKSKTFRLGARIVDEQILAKYPRIGEAVSQPFRVMDHRGEVNKKHHPPRREDEVWRLEKIGRDGAYHKRLSSEGIETVDDFLKTYNEKGPLFLRKLLGPKVPHKAWKAMISNALECDVLMANFVNPSFQLQDLVGNEAMGGEAFEENSEVGKQEINSGDGDELPETLLGFDQELESMLGFGEASTSYGVENIGTLLNQYYQGPSTELMPKPK